MEWVCLSFGVAGINQLVASIKKSFKTMKISYLSIFIITAIFLFSFNDSKSIVKDSDEILWESQRKLVWEDFTGIVDTSSNAEAQTYYQIKIIDSYFEKNLPKYRLGCYFIKSNSWTKTNEKIALQHEQLHFDIAEIFARKIRKKFDSLNIKKCNTQYTYKEIYSRLGKSCDEYHHRYDGEVYFDSVQQKKWRSKVTLELERLKKYAYSAAVK